MHIIHLFFRSFFRPISLTNIKGREQPTNVPAPASISRAASFPSVAQMTGVMERPIRPIVAVKSKNPYFFILSMYRISAMKISATSSEYFDFIDNFPFHKVFLKVLWLILFNGIIR